MQRPSRTSSKRRKTKTRKSIFRKVDIQEDEDGEKSFKSNRKLSIATREKLKQKNLSALTIYLSDWRLQTFKYLQIVPDPNDEIGARLRTLTDLNMFLYVTMLTLVMLSINVGTFLTLFVPGSLVATEADRFLLHFAPYIFLNIWVVPGLAFFLAFSLILILAYHDPSNWTKRFLFLVRIFRYGLTLIVLSCMVCLIFYWIRNLMHVREFIRPQLQSTFNLYVNQSEHQETGIETTTWELTQHKFECCGVDSFQDFYNTGMEEIGAQICIDQDKPDCTEKEMFDSPILVAAFPMICCDNIRYKVCLTAPRAEQVYPDGCLDKTVAWVSIVVGLILVIGIVNVTLGVVTTIVFIKIDRCSFVPTGKVQQAKPVLESREVLIPIVEEIKETDSNTKKDPDPPKVENPFEFEFPGSGAHAL